MDRKRSATVFSEPPHTAEGRHRRPWWWWAAWACAAVALSVLATQAHHTADLTRTLPTNDPELN